MCQTHKQSDCEFFKNWDNLSKIDKVLFTSSDKDLETIMNAYDGLCQSFSNPTEAQFYSINWETAVHPAKQWYDESANITMENWIEQVYNEQYRRKYGFGCFGPFTIETVK